MKKTLLALALVASLGTAWAQPKEYADQLRQGGGARVDVISEDRLSYQVYRAPGGPAPTVFMGHGCSGISGQQVAYARLLNSWGYNAVAVDSWGPRGISHTCKGTKPWYSPSDRMPEFLAIARRIKQEPWHKGGFGYVGWSHGGSLGLNLAYQNDSPFAAVVSYYPNCAPYMVPNRAVRTKTLVHLGGRDKWTPYKNCDDIGGITERMLHPNATHAFDIPAETRDRFGETLEYDAVADVQAREAMRKFFLEHLR